MPDHHPFRYLYQIGEVGGNMKRMRFQTVFHLIPQKLYTGHLDYPGSGDFQVIQKDLAGDVHMVQGILKGGDILSGPAQNLVLKEDGGQLIRF